MVALLVSLASFATIPGTVSYQGLYTDNGGPVTGNFSFTFKLFDALTSGTQVWTETKNLDVTGGIFNTQLGDVSALPVTLFKDGNPYWLEVTVGTTTLTPRVEFDHYVGKAAYCDTALVALSGTGGNELWSTDGTNVWRASGKVGVGTSTFSASDVKLEVKGGNIIVEDGADLPDLTFNALTPQPSGDIRLKKDGAAVSLIRMGSDANGATWNFTDQLRSDNPFYIAGNGCVGIGETNPSVRLVVRGHATSGRDNLVSFMNSDGNHLVTSFDEDNNNWLFRCSGVPYPIAFAMTSTEVLRINTNGNVGIGVSDPEARLHIASGSGKELLFNYNAEIVSKTGAGDIEGFLWPRWSGDVTYLNYGQGGFNIRNHNSVLAMNISDGLDVTIKGNLCVEGQKNAIVPTSEGMTKVYSEESAEVWLTDYSSANVVNGRAEIDLDPHFLETVLIDKEHPMMVFVTQTSGDPVNVVIDKGVTSFTIRCSESIDAAFDYRVQAKRKQFADARLEPYK